MKVAVLIPFLFASMSCKDTTVYVCDSPNAKKYHYSATCRGLSNCTYRVVKKTMKEAKKQGKTLCKWED
jgi:hypothetical protein